MHEYINQKVLCTTQNWFYAPDGKQYKAVHGTMKGIHEAGKTLGFIPNRSHANWFLEIGDITIMGCQVLYVLKCDSVETGQIKDWKNDEKNGGIEQYEHPSVIYITN
jgi:hypothetical protein